ncbi:MAG TPA: hypothetical protein VH063_00615 [Gaiellaceae bacterium]|jgi:hypothetical protein|nr:hypothetical protein [Gaiellaceae bacterium]
MKVLLVMAAALLAVTQAGAAQSITKPGRTRTEGAPIVAISVSGAPGITYAVADNHGNTDCAHVYFMQTGGRSQVWRYGTPTNEPCSEGTSTGDGISGVTMSAHRSLWIQYAGGNLRDWQLFTATPTKRTPKQLAFVEQDVDLPSPIVLGQGSGYTVPYAVRNKVTDLDDNGSAAFKWTAPATVQALAAGQGPNGVAVAVLLDSGVLDLLSGAGKVIGSSTYAPAAVTALFVAPAGVVIQKGSTVEIRKGSATRTFALPSHAKMISYAEGRIYYSVANAIHALGTTSRVDSVLVAPTKGKTTVAYFGDGAGFAWAAGNTLNWDCGGCVNYGR